MYPKSRIDALIDGLFGVAMTILVLDVRLPDPFHSDPTGAEVRFRAAQSGIRTRLSHATVSIPAP